MGHRGQAPSRRRRRPGRRLGIAGIAQEVVSAGGRRDDAARGPRRERAAHALSPRARFPRMRKDTRYLDPEAWVRTWQAAGPRLEAIKAQELQRVDVQAFVRSMADAFRAARASTAP